jgi:hypothetical protein
VGWIPQDGVNVGEIAKASEHLPNPESQLFTPKKKEPDKKTSSPPDTLPASLILFYTTFKMKMHECSQRGWGGEQW